MRSKPIACASPRRKQRVKLLAQTIDEGDLSHAQELLESLGLRQDQEDLRSLD